MANERLEAFRRRLRGPEAPQQTREPLKGKDWVAILVSISALAISAMTAYFSLLRQSEEMQVFFGDPPLLTRTADKRLQVEGKLDMAFMNTGTRPIIVLGVALLIEDTSKRTAASSSPCGSKFGSLRFEVDTFVVKEKESVTKLLTVRFDPRWPPESAQLMPDGRISVLAPKDVRGDPSRSVVMCVRIVGATPSRQPLIADIELAESEWSSEGPRATGYPTISFAATRPRAVIWTKQGTIFNFD
ncbi:hypothetical protein [Bradyrhizobium sp. USDA 4502]